MLNYVEMSCRANNRVERLHFRVLVDVAVSAQASKWSMSGWELSDFFISVVGKLERLCICACERLSIWVFVHLSA